MNHSTQAEPGALPRRGEFGGQPLVGPFQPDARAMHSDAPLFGMPPESLYAWGSLRDDQGDLHTIMRRIPHNGKAASPRRLLVQSTIGGKDQLRMHESGLTTAPHTDPIRELIDDDTIEWRSNPDAQGSPFRLRWANETCEWVEEGVFELTGTPIKPGMQ